MGEVLWGVSQDGNDRPPLGIWMVDRHPVQKFFDAFNVQRPRNKERVSGTVHCRPLSLRGYSFGLKYLWKRVNAIGLRCDDGAVRSTLSFAGIAIEDQDWNAVLLALDHVARPADLDASQVEGLRKRAADVAETPSQSKGSHGPGAYVIEDSDGRKDNREYR